MQFFISFFLLLRRSPKSTLFPYTTLFRSYGFIEFWGFPEYLVQLLHLMVKFIPQKEARDRKSTRLNSSHVRISYAVFCLKKKKKQNKRNRSSHIGAHVKLLSYVVTDAIYS